MVVTDICVSPLINGLAIEPAWKKFIIAINITVLSYVHPCKRVCWETQ